MECRRGGFVLFLLLATGAVLPQAAAGDQVYDRAPNLVSDVAALGDDFIWPELTFSERTSAQDRFVVKAARFGSEARTLTREAPQGGALDLGTDAAGLPTVLFSSAGDLYSVPLGGGPQRKLAVSSRRCAETDARMVGGAVVFKREAQSPTCRPGLYIAHPGRAPRPVLDTGYTSRRGRANTITSFDFDGQRVAFTRDSSPRRPPFRRVVGKVGILQLGQTKATILSRTVAGRRSGSSRTGRSRVGQVALAPDFAYWVLTSSGDGGRREDIVRRPLDRSAKVTALEREGRLYATSGTAAPDRPIGGRDTLSSFDVTGGRILYTLEDTRIVRVEPEPAVFR